MAKREMAVFTIVQADNWMAERWHRYYAKHFDSKDIYVLDHLLKNKGCTEKIEKDCVVQRLYHEFSFDHEWLCDTVKKKQAALLENYEKVLFTEIDEFVCPDPNFKSLREYVGEFSGTTARVVGYNVLQAEGESSLDLSAKSILSQRSIWSRQEAFDKPLLSTKPLNFKVGFHEAESCERELIDEKLFLIHLKWCCLDRLLQKNAEICKRKWSHFDWISYRGAEHKMLEKQKVVNYIQENMKNPEMIPDRFRSVL
jgi:hypothetical protein